MKRWYQYALAAFVAVPIAACGPGGSDTRGVSGQSGLEAKGSHQGPPVTGTVKVTDEHASQPQINHFAAKEDVYIHAHPFLSPDGEWYYQVTDPGCKELLAGPHDEGIWDTTGNSFTVIDGQAGPHPIAPFRDTPNPGGVYKVHVTPVDQLGDVEDGCFGFIPRFSKTKTFKVDDEEPVPPDERVCLEGVKFYDLAFFADNNNNNDEFTPVEGFKIILNHPDTTTDVAYTDSLGEFTFCVDEVGTYVVEEELPPTSAWFQTYPEQLTYAVDVTDLAMADVTGLDFGNVCFGPGGQPLFDWLLKKEKLEFIHFDFQQILDSNILANAFVLARFGAIASGAELAAVLEGDLSDPDDELAAWLIVLQLNILKADEGAIHADTVVRVNHDTFMTGAELLAHLLVEAEGDATERAAALALVKAVFEGGVLQDEPCPIDYPY
jgi:hypothetical protein